MENLKVTGWKLHQAEHFECLEIEAHFECFEMLKNVLHSISRVIFPYSIGRHGCVDNREQWRFLTMVASLRYNQMKWTHINLLS